MTTPSTSDQDRQEQRRIAAQKLHEAAQLLQAYGADEDLVHGVNMAAEDVFNG